MLSQPVEIELGTPQRATREAVVAALAVIVMLVPQSAHAERALFISGGRVWTGDPDRPWAEAVLCVQDKIAAVGDADELARIAPSHAQRVDASGGLVTPGWWDSHVHVFDGGRNLAGVQLRDADTREEFVRRIGEFANTRAPGEWIRGGDWDHTRWGGELPTRNWIDAVTPDNPVWIQRLDGHMALANSAALRAAGIDDSTPTPEGGAIDRDAAGRPTGLLRDNAMGLVASVAPEPSGAELLESLHAASDYLLSCGVTSIVHMGSLSELRALRAARAQGRLKIRVYAATPLPRWRLLQQEIEANGRGDEFLQVGGLKGFVDGSLGSHTAAFLEPYTDQPTDRGLLVNSRDDLYAWTAGADAAGLQVMVHAIGDRAIRTQLDIFERVAMENGPRDRRFRIEHSQHIAPSDIARFGELSVIASMQPYHAIDDGRWAEGLIGPARCRTTYAFRDLLDTGARVSLGSDWFVAPPTPIEGIDAAVTRRTLDGLNPDGWYPDQRITVEEALRGYTVHAAYSAFAEKDRGAIKPGMLADLTIVDRDLFEIPEADLPNAVVLYTVIDGRIAYHKP